MRACVYALLAKVRATTGMVQTTKLTGVLKDVLTPKVGKVRNLSDARKRITAWHTSFKTLKTLVKPLSKDNLLRDVDREWFDRYVAEHAPPYLAEMVGLSVEQQQEECSTHTAAE